MKSIGIIGGMGPLATVDLFGKIVQMTRAGSDREHIQVYVDNNTNIPDRTGAILHGGEDPRREMIRSAIKLEAMGADVLVMPCNTAHYFHEDVKAYVSIPFLSMIEETVEEIARGSFHTVGLLATTGTVRSGVYEKAMEARGITPVKPTDEGMTHVMDLIYNGVKAGNADWPIQPFLDVLEDLRRRGAQTMILGCTELPIAFEQHRIGYPFIDPTSALAKSAIRFAGGALKE